MNITFTTQTYHNISDSEGDAQVTLAMRIAAGGKQSCSVTLVHNNYCWQKPM